MAASSSSAGAAQPTDDVQSSSSAAQPTDDVESSSGAAQPTDDVQSVIQDCRDRISKFGKFPRRHANPGTEADHEENALWQYLYHRKAKIPDDVWKDFRTDIVEELRAFVEEYKRWPKRHGTGADEDSLAQRLTAKKIKKLSDAQKIQVGALQEQCQRLQERYCYAATR
jgi:hypothetical protein